MIHLFPHAVMRPMLRCACVCTMLAALVPARAGAQVERGRWATLGFDNGTLIVDSRSDHRVEITLLREPRALRGLFDPAAVSGWGSAAQQITSDAHVAATYPHGHRGYRAPVLASADGMALRMTCEAGAGTARCRFTVTSGATEVHLQPAIPAADVIPFALMMRQAGGYASLQNWFGSDTARSQYAPALRAARGVGAPHPPPAEASASRGDPRPTHTLAEADSEPPAVGDDIAFGGVVARLRLSTSDSTIRIQVIHDKPPIVLPVDTLARWLAALHATPLVDAPGGACAERCMDTLSRMSAVDRVRGLERGSYGYIVRRRGEGGVNGATYDFVLADGPGDWNMVREMGADASGVRALAARVERATAIAACVLRRPARRGSSSRGSADGAARLATAGPPPAYPPALSARQIAVVGKVRARFALDTLGRVDPASITIIESPSPHFSASVCAALLDLHATTPPARRYGEMRLEREFTIRP